jgi:hypothetical protein
MYIARCSGRPSTGSSSPVCAPFALSLSRRTAICASDPAAGAATDPPCPIARTDAICSFPFAIFAVPVLGNLLHRAKATGYDRNGLLVPKLSPGLIFRAPPSLNAHAPHHACTIPRPTHPSSRLHHPSSHSTAPRPSSPATTSLRVPAHQARSRTSRSRRSGRRRRPSASSACYGAPSSHRSSTRPRQSSRCPRCAPSRPELHLHLHLLISSPSHTSHTRCHLWQSMVKRRARRDAVVADALYFAGLGLLRSRVRLRTSVSNALDKTETAAEWASDSAQWASDTSVKNATAAEWTTALTVHALSLQPVHSSH